MSKIDNLVSRLHKVKRNGNDYVACCPAHDDKSPSLTICEKDDGRILVHCFGGCPPEEVLGAIGLELKDLMPENVGYHRKKKERRPFNPMDVLSAVRADLTLALVICKDMQKGKVLDDQESLELARLIGRVTMAIELAGGE